MRLPHFTPALSPRLPYFSPTSYKLGVPMTPSPGLAICWNYSQNSGNTYVYWFIIRDITQEQLNGRDTQGKVWGCTGAASFPLQAPPCQHVQEFTNPEAPQTMLFRHFNGDFFIWVWLTKLLAIGDWTQPPDPLPYLEVGWGSKFQISNHALAFLETSPFRKVTRGPQPPVISLAYRR